MQHLGELIKIKARLCANGKTQKLLPYQNSYSPTVQSWAVMIALKQATINNDEIRVIDFTGAYLHAPIDADTYMTLSNQVVEILIDLDPTCVSFIRPDGTLLVQLQKALYGLKQSGALWNKTLDEFLKVKGFTPNPIDPCVFNANRNGSQITIAIHVDDCLSIGKTENLD